MSSLSTLASFGAKHLTLRPLLSPTPVPPTTQSIAYAMATLKAATSTATTNRPLHLSVAMDTSGSMNGEKLEMAKAALRFHRAIKDGLRAALTSALRDDDNVERESVKAATHRGVKVHALGHDDRDRRRRIVGNEA